MDPLSDLLKKGSMESFFWRVAGVISLFLMHAMLGQKLSPESYGLFSFTLSIVTVLVLFVTMGWPAALVKLVPQYIIKQQWGLLKGALFRSHQMSLGLSVIFSMMLMYSSISLESSRHADAMFYASILLPIMSLIALRRRIFQGLHSVKGSIVPDEVLFPGVVLVGLFIIEQPSIDGAMLIYVLASSAVLFLTFIWLWNILPLELRKTTSVFESRMWARLAFPLLLGGFSQIILTQSGVVILGLYDLQGAGLFSASVRFALFVTFTMTAINVIGMPMLATAFHNKDTAALTLIYKRTMLWSFIGALPPAIIFILFPSFVLSLFGDEFRQAATLLQILVLGQLVNTAVGLSGSLLIVAGEEKYFARSMVVTACFCVFFMFITVPMWGALAASIVYSVSIALLSIAQLFQASKLIKV